MNLRIRLLLLLLALGSALFLGMGMWYREDQEQMSRLLQGSYRSQEALIDKVFRLYGRDLETYDSDYSLWTELGDYIAHPKPGWAAGNIDTGLNSFKADAVWLLDPQGKVVHRAVRDDQKALYSLLGTAISPPMFVSPEAPLRQFYVSWRGRIVEVRAAKIVDSDDVERRGRARGTMMVARVWNEDHLLALGEFLGAKARLSSMVSGPQSDLSELSGAHRRLLRGPTGRPVAALEVAFPNSNLAGMQEETHDEATRLLFGSLVLIGLFVGFTLAWISKPLRQIMDSLADGRPESVAALAKHRDEFGQIGRLVLASFELKREIKAREEQKTAVLESAIDAVITMDANGDILELNRAAEAMFGVLRHAVVGKNLGEVIIPEKYRAMHNQGVLRHRGPLSKRVEISALRCDGTEFPVEISLICVPQGDSRVFTGFIRDLSEQRRLEEQLRNAQKMESLGLLAAGVAHEINTPMQYVLDNTKFLAEGSTVLSNLLSEYRELRTAVEGDPKYGERAAMLVEKEEAADAEFLFEEMPLAAEQSMRGIDRVRKIVRAMRQMAHPGEESMRPMALNGVMEDALALVRNEAKTVADLELRLQPGLPDVQCDSGAIGQVVVNLVVNALHAIADSTTPEKRGKIVLGTRTVGDSVEITIEDNGPGIPDAIRHRIFDPFFTTKPVGKGTGQGLSIVFSIVKRHGGTIDFSNNREGGTTFVVSLPAAQAVAA